LHNTSKKINFRSKGTTTLSSLGLMLGSGFVYSVTTNCRIQTLHADSNSAFFVEYKRIVIKELIFNFRAGVKYLPVRTKSNLQLAQTVKRSWLLSRFNLYVDDYRNTVFLVVNLIMLDQENYSTKDFFDEYGVGF
jgi:hypothetical protein